MVINKSGNLKDRILELNRKCEVINREISAMMLYHSIINSDHKSIARKILVEQTKSNNKNTMISKVQQIAREIGVKLKNVENMRK